MSADSDAQLATGNPSTARSFRPPSAIDHGVGGTSATNEYKRRVDKHEKQIEARWGTGRVGRFAKFMSDEPQSTKAWAKGAEGERKLAQRLNDGLCEVAIVLHDRKVPKARGNIDHLVVAPNGIWIIDAKNYAGKVEQRDTGGWFASNLQVYVDGRNQTKLVAGLEWQVDAVKAALASAGFSEIPLHPSLCFTDSQWGIFSKPIKIDGVLITWPTNLLEAISTPGTFDFDTMETLAHQLSSHLPAAA